MRLWVKLPRQCFSTQNKAPPLPWGQTSICKRYKLKMNTRWPKYKDISGQNMVFPFLHYLVCLIHACEWVFIYKYIWGLFFCYRGNSQGLSIEYYIPRYQNYFLPVLNPWVFMMKRKALCSMNDTVQFIIKVMNFYFAFPFQTPTDFHVFQLHLQRLKSHPNNALILITRKNTVSGWMKHRFSPKKKTEGKKKQKQKHRKLNLLHFLL